MGCSRNDEEDAEGERSEKGALKKFKDRYVSSEKTEERSEEEIRGCVHKESYG